MTNKAAIIYIGSNALYLQIGESTPEKKVRTLEGLKYPLSLGIDTFTKDKISSNKANEICKALENFLRIIKEYRIENIQAVATTAIRQAKNKSYILDQIRIKTGLNIKVLDDSSEKTYMYKGMYKKIANNSKLKDKEAVLAYIGTGRLGVAHYSKGYIKSNHNVRVGSLKLNEILGEIKEKTNRFYQVVEEYLNSFSYMLKSLLPLAKIDYFIASGKEIELIAQLCAVQNTKELAYISKEKFQDLYYKVQNKTPTQLINSYQINKNQAEILIPTIIIYNTILEFTEAEDIIASFVSLTDILIHQMLYQQESDRLNQIFAKNTILTSKSIGHRYSYHQEHAEAVTKFTLKIFDKLNQLHGMGTRERLLLQVAALLHDVGKYISLKNHYFHSYDIIQAANILGLNNREVEIAANIAKYHSKMLPENTDRSYQRLTNKERVLVAKLIAILRLGDALDKSHQQKIADIEAQVNSDKNELVITALTNQDTLLEKWTLKEKSNFFTEIFGIEVAFSKKPINPR